MSTFGNKTLWGLHGSAMGTKPSFKQDSFLSLPLINPLKYNVDFIPLSILIILEVGWGWGCNLQVFLTVLFSFTDWIFYVHLCFSIKILTRYWDPNSSQFACDKLFIFSDMLRCTFHILYSQTLFTKTVPICGISYATLTESSSRLYSIQSATLQSVKISSK